MCRSRPCHRRCGYPAFRNLRRHAKHLITAVQSPWLQPVTQHAQTGLDRLGLDCLLEYALLKEEGRILALVPDKSQPLALQVQIACSNKLLAQAQSATALSRYYPWTALWTT